jgi:hypothetical protein
MSCVWTHNLKSERDVGSRLYSASYQPCDHDQICFLGAGFFPVNGNNDFSYLMSIHEG